MNKNIIIYGAAGTGKTRQYLIPAIENFNGLAIGISKKDERNLFSKPECINFLDVDALGKLEKQEDIFINNDKIFIYTGFNDKESFMRLLNYISLQHEKEILVAIDEFINYDFENNKDIILRLLENNSVKVIICIQSLNALKDKYKDIFNVIVNSCKFISSKKLIEYSGDLRIRFPKSLHRELAIRAEIEGVSLNQYVVYLLSKGIGLSKKEIWVNNINEILRNRNKKNKKVNDDSKMKRIEILDGYVTCPKEWVILDENTAKKKYYVGVVEIKNGSKYNAPHFLFFSDIPISQLNENDINLIDNKCYEKWNKYKQVLNDYVKPEYDKNRNITNFKEYSECPVPGYFDIPESDNLYSSFPCGAKIFRYK